MIKKVKGSLALKVFILLALLLFAASCILYGIVMQLIPRGYQNLTAENYTASLQKLAADLENGTAEEATKKIYDFCVVHGARATLSDGTSVTHFGMSEETGAAPADTDGATAATVAFSIDSQPYELYVSVANSTLNQITQAFQNILPAVLVFVLILSAAGAFCCSRYLTKPVVLISNISRRMTALDMTWRCDVNRTDEIGVLAGNLNIMAERLDMTLHELKDANAKLQEDIDKERLREKQRVDFFRAVSHELKTPITVLKGELEGMIYGVGEYKDRDKHLRHSAKTVTEMENLVKEILTASRMAEKDARTVPEETNIGEIVTECSRRLQGVVEDKGIMLSADVQPDCVVQGDAAMLFKAVSNIIGNAVKHTPEKGRVIIRLQNHILTVENTGVQIAPADMERIFEPFYRTDPSHNHSTGGSGLGLYIVKGILGRHGIPFQFTNTARGVCFTVRFQ